VLIQDAMNGGLRSLRNYSLEFVLDRRRYRMSPIEYTSLTAKG
jgi:hypothetical protein